MLRIRTIVMLVACCTAVALAQNRAAASEQTPPNQAQPVSPRVRISTGVMLGLVKQKTLPVYPDEAMKKGIQGDVILKIEADETGKIIWSAPVQGDPLLVDASTEALKTFRFAPYLLNGAPVKFESQLGFHFSVEKTADGANGHVECMTTIPARP
ncbi:MAG: energy transducer TonB [Terriglobales bacterium]|jgi:TonB family protein